MKSPSFALVGLLAIGICSQPTPVTAAEGELTFKNTGKTPLTIELHRRGMKDEPQIPLPLKAGESRAMKPQEDTYYGMVVIDDTGARHRVGYRRMRGLTVKHPGAVIELRPQVAEVEEKKVIVVMVPHIRLVIDEETGEKKKITELKPEEREIVVTMRKVTGYDVVLTKDGADDLPLEFRKFVKPPKEEAENE